MCVNSTVHNLVSCISRLAAMFRCILCAKHVSVARVSLNVVTKLLDLHHERALTEAAILSLQIICNLYLRDMCHWLSFLCLNYASLSLSACRRHPRICPSMCGHLLKPCSLVQHRQKIKSTYSGACVPPLFMSVAAFMFRGQVDQGQQDGSVPQYPTFRTR